MRGIHHPGVAGTCFASPAYVAWSRGTDVPTCRSSRGTGTFLTLPYYMREAEPVDILGLVFLCGATATMGSSMFRVERNCALEESGGLVGDVLNRHQDVLAFAVPFCWHSPGYHARVSGGCNAVNLIILHNDCDLLLRQPRAPSGVGRRDHVRKYLAQIPIAVGRACTEDQSVQAGLESPGVHRRRNALTATL